MGYYSIVVCGKSKCPGARLDLTVNFHHEHFIDPTNCPWVSEDGKTHTPRFTDFFTDFEKKTDCFAVYSPLNM